MGSTPINEIKSLFANDMDPKNVNSLENASGENDFESNEEQFDYLVKNEKWKEALRLLESGKLEKERLEVSYQKIDLLLNLKEVEKASSVLTELKTEFGGSSLYLLYKARILAQSGELAKALDVSEKALKKDKKNYYYWFWNGILSKRNELLKKAKNAFEKSIRFNPDHVMANYYLGIVLYEMKDYKKAIENFLLCLDLDDVSQKNTMWYLGQCYERLKKHDEAQAYYQKFKNY